MNWLRQIINAGVRQTKGVVDADGKLAPVIYVSGDDGNELVGSAGDAAYSGANVIADKPSSMGLLAGIWLYLKSLASVVQAGSLQVSIVSGDVEETLWTDDTNAYFIRHVNASAVTWTDVGGNPSAAPGASARPAAATAGVVDRSSWQATTNGAGFSVGDLLDHFVVTNPTSGAVIGHFWINGTTEAKLAAAPSASAITPISTTPAPAIATATISDGASLSNLILLDGKLPGGFYIPASFEGGFIQFQRTPDGATFYDVYDEYGAKRQMTAGSSTFVQLANPAEWLGAKGMKIRSVTVAGAAQNQTGDAAVLVPLQA